MMRSNPIPEKFIENVAECAHWLRRQHDGANWDMAGIRKAVNQAAELVDPSQLMQVVAKAANNPLMNTPAAIAAPGPQWEGTTKATTKVATPCPDHPTVPLTKCRCQQIEGTPKPDNFADLIKAARDTQEDDQ